MPAIESVSGRSGITTSDVGTHAWPSHHQYPSSEKPLTRAALCVPDPRFECGYDRGVRARINDIPAAEAPTWAAVLALLRFDNREHTTWHWTAERPSAGEPFSVIDIEVPGEDIDALRAELEEAVNLVNEIVERDPTKTMRRADIGLSEVYLK